MSNDLRTEPPGSLPFWNKSLQTAWGLTPPNTRDKLHQHNRSLIQTILSRNFAAGQLVLDWTYTTEVIPYRIISVNLLPDNVWSLAVEMVLNETSTRESIPLWTPPSPGPHHHSTRYKYRGLCWSGMRIINFRYNSMLNETRKCKFCTPGGGT